MKIIPNQGRNPGGDMEGFQIILETFEELEKFHINFENFIENFRKS